MSTSQYIGPRPVFFDGDDAVTRIDMRAPRLPVHDLAPPRSARGTLGPPLPAVAGRVRSNTRSRAVRLAWCIPHIAALLLAAGTGMAAAFVTDHFQIPITGETLVPLLVASAFAAWFVFGLFGPARALPAMLAAAVSAVLLVAAPVGASPDITLTFAASAMVLGTAFASRSARAR